MVSPKQIGRVYFISRALDTPLWAIFNMLPFILVKEFNATTFQLAVFIALKPLVSILSLYWSSLVHGKPEKLKSNLCTAKILGCLPFFFFPFFNHVWFFILASGFYMCFAVGIVPAWMEILKRNLPQKECNKAFAYGSTVGYLGGGLLPILFGSILDHSEGVWKLLFPASGCLSLLFLFLLKRIDVCDELRQESIQKSETTSSWIEKLIKPWKISWQIVASNPEFFHYQCGFMIMGTGLMMMQPALPNYFVEQLSLSYVEIGVALAFCKGISYAISSPLWAKYLHHANIFSLSYYVTALACFFPVLLLFAQWNIHWVYAAYICYGCMQAGSELSWNMSGPIFSKANDSTVYSGVNVVTVGIRGLFAPALGSLFASLLGIKGVLVVGAVFFAASAFFFQTQLNSYALRASSKER